MGAIKALETRSAAVELRDAAPPPATPGPSKAEEGGTQNAVANLP